MSAVPIPGSTPVEVVSFIPVLAPRRDPSALAVAAGPPEVVSTEILRADGKHELRRETTQEGVRVGGNPAWYTGPAPFRVQRGVIGDTTFRQFDDSGSLKERRSFVSAVVAKRLYGDGKREHRAALPADQHSEWVAGDSKRGTGMGEVTVICLELLRFESVEGMADALLMVHARVGGADLGELLRGIRLVAMSGDPRRPEGRRARAWIAHLARGTATLAPEHLASYHIAYESPTQPLPVLDAENEAAGWSREEQWLWSLATLHDRDAYAIGVQNRKQLESATRWLSADWRVAVMRRGAAIVTRPVDDPWEPRDGGHRRLGYLGEVAPMMTRSLFTDAFALGLMKRLMLDGFTSRLADLEDPVTAPLELSELDSDFTRFRNAAWRENMGRSGQATFLLRNYDAAASLGRQYDRLVADLSDYSQKVERAAVQKSNTISQATNALIGLVTCFGVPLGALQVFTTGELWVWLVIAAYMVGLGLVPAGEQVIGGILPARIASKVGVVARTAWCLFWVILIGLLLVFGVIPTDTPTAARDAKGAQFDNPAVLPPPQQSPAPKP